MLFTYAIPILIIVAFLSGLYFCVKYSSPKSLEGLTNMSQPRCPNILVQKGLKYYLHNSKIAKVPGVNPIEFANLEEYVEFLDWQRSQGIRCPVLYLQHTYDAQGDAVYKVRPGVTEMQGGLPPTSTTAKNASNQLPLSSLQNPNPTLLVDTMNQAQENLLYSPDPMSDNWGGADYTQKLVDTGYYKGNEVSILVQ
jgi:hypothetical protein